MKSGRKKQNKYLPLIILLVLVLFLAVAYAALSKANDRAAAEAAAEEEAANAKIMVADYDYTTLISISYSHNGEDPISLLVNGSAWEYASDSKFPLDSDTVASMASAIASIGADRTVDEGSEEDYGLGEDAAYVINVKYSDGDKHEYRIGDYNSFSASYYFWADGDLYMIPSGLTSYFDYELDDLLVLDTLPSSDWTETETISKVVVSSDGRTNEITDTDGIASAITYVKKLYLYDCADYYADDEEKASYGIDGEDYVSVTYKKAVTTTDEDGNESTNYLETTYKILFGDTTDEGILGGPEKSTIVYNFDADNVASVIELLDYVPEPETEETEDSEVDE